MRWVVVYIAKKRINPNNGVCHQWTQRLGEGLCPAHIFIKSVVLSWLPFVCSKFINNNSKELMQRLIGKNSHWQYNRCYSITDGWFNNSLKWPQQPLLWLKWSLKLICPAFKYFLFTLTNQNYYGGYHLNNARWYVSSLYLIHLLIFLVSDLLLKRLQVYRNGWNNNDIFNSLSTSWSGGTC